MARPVEHFRFHPARAAPHCLELPVLLTRVRTGWVRPRNSFKLTFESREESDLQQLIEFFDDMAGQNKPFKWTHPTTGEIFAMRFASDEYDLNIKSQNDDGAVGDLSFDIIEVGGDLVQELTFDVELDWTLGQPDAISIEASSDPDPTPASSEPASSEPTSSEPTSSEPGTTASLDGHTFSNGDTLYLQRGQTYSLSGPLTIHANNVSILARGSGDPPMVNFKGGGYDWSGAFEFWGDHATLDGIDFTLSSKHYGCRARSGSSNVTVRNCTVWAGGGLFEGEGFNTCLIDSCQMASGVIHDRNFIFCGTVDHYGLTVQNCRSYGSRYEHCIRIHMGHHVKIHDCNLANTYNGKQNINMRDGDDFELYNLTLTGPSVIGPLADGNKDLNKQLTNFVLRNSTQNKGYMILEAGLVNANIHDFTIHADKSGYAISASWGYLDRPATSGTLTNVTATYSGGAFQSGPKLHTNSVTFNGVAIPNS